MADRIQGLPGYHRAQDDLPPTQPQTVFPKSQGNQQPAAPDATPIPGLPDYKRATPTSSTAAPASQNSLLYDMFHPTDADLSRPQTWHDWLTKTYSPSASQVGSAALDDVSFGTADAIQSKITGENVGNIRARTADAQAALGPMGPVVNALTYAVPGTGELKFAVTPGRLIHSAAELANAGRYGTAAVEGGTAAALSSAGHQAGDPNGIDALKVAKDAGWGAAGGTVMQGLGDVTAPVAQKVGNWATGKPGTSSEQWSSNPQDNWRARAAAGDPTLQGDIAVSQATLPPDHPAQPALAKVQGALAQPTDPGNVAHAVTGAGAWYGSKLLGGDELTQLAAGGISPFASKYFVNKPAQMINTVDRNINVGQSMDQLYPALTNNPASTTDTSGWANALRQGWIGGERSTDQAGDAQWW
jgi:hypothetical protein